MNENEFDLTARAWLDDGPTRMSDRALLSALEEIHTTRQRRAWWPARRATPVNMFARAAIAAVLVVGVGFAAVNFLPLGSGVGGPTASPSPSVSTPPSAAPSATPSAAGIPELTQTYVSSINGFSIRYPDGAQLEPATAVWTPYSDAQEYAGRDFVHTERFGSFRVGSAKAQDGVPIDDWVDAAIIKVTPGGCGAPSGTVPEITIDGRSARLQLGCPGEIGATVVVDGRVWQFELFSDATDARAMFDAYISTIDLRPEDVPGASAPAPS